jgi:hypothetical protein
VADDVRVVGAFLRLEEHRNVPPRRDIEAALAGWCIAVDRAVPDGDGVVAIVRRKSVHSKKPERRFFFVSIESAANTNHAHKKRKKSNTTTTLSVFVFAFGLVFVFVFVFGRIEKDGGLFVSNRARCY